MIPRLLVILFVFPMLGLSAARAEPGRRAPSIVAHRGLLMHAPENTLANFRACLALRLGFEFDVRRTRDGHLVCVHDETVDRTTDGRGAVLNRTLAEIRQLDAGRWFHPSFQGERIPTVAEIFELLGQHRELPVLVAVDLKGDDEAIEPDVVRLANQHRVLDKLLFIGRAIEVPQVRARLRAADAKTQVACLANRSDEFARALNEPSADWVYVRYVPSASEVQQAVTQGKRVFIAGTTVAGQETANWRKAAEVGLHAILTDYPLELRPILQGTR